MALLGERLASVMLVRAPAAMAAAGWTIPMTIVRRRGEHGSRRSRRPARAHRPARRDGGGGPRLQPLAPGCLPAVPGAVADEMRLTLQEQRMGLSTNASLTNMLARSETPSMAASSARSSRGKRSACRWNDHAQPRDRDPQTAPSEPEERAHKAPSRCSSRSSSSCSRRCSSCCCTRRIYTFGQTFGS